MLRNSWTTTISLFRHDITASILEAMALGIPIVARGCAGNRRLLKDWPGSVVFEMKDVAGATAAVAAKLKEYEDGMMEKHYKPIEGSVKVYSLKQKQTTSTGGSRLSCTLETEASAWKAVLATVHT